VFEKMDERGIEGLPVRLVIALVVGVASLSVMMNTLSGLTTLGVSELNAQPEPEVIGANETDVTVRVVDAQGEPVANATVVAQGGTANLGGLQTAATGENGRASLTLRPSLGPNQDEGTVTLDIKPPASGGYTDERQNTKVLVVADR
jgi:hypothetical protein